MATLLRQSLWPAYGLIFIVDADAPLPEPSPEPGATSSDATGVIVAIRPYDETEIDLAICDGSPDAGLVAGLIQAFDGRIVHGSGKGLLVGAPTGDELHVGDVAEGPVRVRIWHDAYPAERVVVAIGGD